MGYVFEAVLSGLSTKMGQHTLLLFAKIEWQAAGELKLWSNMRAAERICAIGLARPLPAMSGAVPPAGS